MLLLSSVVMLLQTRYVITLRADFDFTFDEVTANTSPSAREKLSLPGLFENTHVRLMTGLALLESVANAFTLHECVTKVEVYTVFGSNESRRPQFTQVGKHEWDTFQWNDFNKFECD